MKTFIDIDNCRCPFDSFLEECGKLYPTRTALSMFDGREWKELSYTELRKQSLIRAAQLRVAGVKKGSRVVFLGESSIDWVVNFFGVLLCGAIAVPLDIKLTEAELSHIVDHTEPSLILASNKLRGTARALRHLKSSSGKAIKVLGMEALPLDALSLFPTEEFHPEPATKTDLAVICYTSGTSGSPNGVMTSAGAMIFEADATFAVDTHAGPTEVILSILPFNHLFGLVAGGLLYALRSGQEFCIAHDLAPLSIIEIIRARKVTQVLAIPLFAKLLMRSIKTKAMEDASRTKKLAFKASIRSMKRVPVRSVQNVLFKKIKKAIGPSLKRFICGGAELDSEVSDFFKAVGIPVYVGYGLTETGPVISVNTAGDNRRGSVGRVLPGVEVKIVDGEILTRGPNLMLGYFKNPELTSQVITKDGWFRTGDIGEIDRDGYLFIRGRLKALIVLSSGKKIHPEEVECVLSRSTLIKDICVIGLKTDGDMGELVTAVVQPSEVALTTIGSDTKQLEAAISKDIQKLALELTQYKRPRQVIVKTNGFAMTSSMKIKRHALMKEFAEKKARVS